MIVIVSETSIIVRPLYYCEYCFKPVYENFAGGRFCSRSCACGWASQMQSGEAKRRKVRNLSHKGAHKLKVCVVCGKEFRSNFEDLCPECREKYQVASRNVEIQLSIKKEILGNNYAPPGCDKELLDELSGCIDNSSTKRLISSLKDYLRDNVSYKPRHNIVSIASALANILYSRDMLAEYMALHST